MRVCLVSQAPFLAGAEVAMERLAGGLRDRPDIEVCCVIGTDGDFLRHMRDQGFETHYIPTYLTGWRTALGYFRSRHSLRQLFRKWRPDVVHSNDLPTHQLTSDAARGTGITRICHHRCFFGGEAIDWLNKYGAERHLFVSEALRRELSLSSSLLAQAPGAVVYDGLPLCSIPDHESRENAKRALGLPVEKAIMLFAGQIIERKGVADILHAWQMLHPTWHRFAELVIVGEDLEKQGAYRRAMEALANQLGCNPRFMGFQRNVPTWLTAADIVLVPSHAEPLGNAVLEAMAHSRPVISSNAGGLPEMTQDRETGILVPIASPRALAAAIESLLSDSVWREQLGQAARKRCEQFFSIDAHVSEILKQYKIGRAVLAVQS